MSNNRNSMNIMVFTALLTALTVLFTMVLKIPVGPDCYIHLGEPIVFLAVMALPRKYACFSGAVGTALADILGGYAFWAPWTFVVQLIVVLIFGFFIDRAKNSSGSRKILNIPFAEFLGYVVTVVIGTIVYFFAEYMLFGNIVEAATCIPFRILLLTSGGIIAGCSLKALESGQLRETFYYKRP